jgi:outer membrane murein-binding lipoprotein Lpp
MKRIGLIILVIFFTVVIWGWLFSNPAFSQRIESRLNNLESDFNTLQSRVNRLESLLTQGRQVPPIGTPSTSPQLPRTRNLPQAERERMFDRLATLVIELKQQVNKLEARVAQLEK